MSQWQKIETAPKNGSLIIGWFPDLNQCCQFTHWIDSEEVEYGKVIRASKKWYCPYYPILWGDKSPEPQPTHWMPLPSSPNLPSNPPGEAPK